MARARKLEVCILNIALTRQQNEAPTPDDYYRLIRAAFLAKQAVVLRGDRRGLLVQVDKRPVEGRLSGVVATFTDVDVTDSWINTASGKEAGPDDLEKLNIPASLRPHHRRYNFQFDLAAHKLAIETKSEPETGKDRLKLTPGTAAALFEGLFRAEPLLEEFGSVGVTVLPHQEAIDAIINWKHAESIEVRIKPPNPDDEDLEERIEERMASMNAARWDQGFRASGDDALSPDKDLKAAMRVAARNGYVVAIGHEHGVRRKLSTKDAPLLIDEHYDPAVEPHVNAFKRVAGDAIAAARKKKVKQKQRKTRPRRNN